MAKSKTTTVKNPKLLEKALEHIEELWTKRERRFMTALEDNDKKRITLGFSVVLDLGDIAPVVDTELTFRDKAKENGMDVVLSYHAKLSHSFEDPNQARLQIGDEKAKEKE